LTSSNNLQPIITMMIPIAKELQADMNNVRNVITLNQLRLIELLIHPTHLVLYTTWEHSLQENNGGTTTA
jgi:hypothetical protein